MNKTSKFALIALVVAFAAVSTLAVMGRRHDAVQTAQIADLKAQIARQQAEIQKTAAAAAESDQKRAQFAAKAKAARQSLLEARAAAAAVTPAPAAAVTPSSDDSISGDKKKKTTSPFAESIAKMMKDPAMKNMMRSSQSMALRQMYGDLVKQWSLSPEETNTFYDLLLDKQMAQMDVGMDVLQKGTSAGVTPPADPDAKIKESLGGDLYKQYQAYEKTLPAHMAVNQFQQQLAMGNTPPLTADQSSILLQAITEEQAAQPAGSYSFSGTGANANSFVMDTDHVDQMLKAQGELNDKIDARMANTLSPEQLQALKQQQEQTLSMQRMGMEMAAKMMGPSPTP